MSCKSTVFVCLSLFLLASPADAFRGRGGADPRTLDPPAAAVRTERVQPGPGSRASTSALEFLQQRGGEWRFEVDPRTERATMVRGSGVPLVPGRGNELDRASLAGLSLPDGDVSIETLAPLARAFIEQNAKLLAPGNGRLVLDRETSATRDRGRLHSLYFEWFVGDVPVEHARVFVRINHGNITQFGAPLIGRVDVATEPTILAGEAGRALLAHSGDEEAARWLGDPVLRLQPEGDDLQLDYRLVWVLRYTVAGRIETWEGRVDAHSGQVVAFRDTNLYAGRVEGGVYPRTVTDSEIRVPMPLASVSGAAGPVSDTAGAFAYTGGVVSSGLDGPYFSTNCEGCSAPSQAIRQISIGSGRIDFGLGGSDEIGNGASTPAERNAFYHLNQVRRIAGKWLSLGWLNTTVGINVNIQDTCNAVWTGAANFFRSGGGCNNTGEISDVMYHEWGHGLDGNTRGGDGATGEATADVVSIHMTHSPLIGPYFNVGGGPVRNIDSSTSSRGLLTTGNIAQKCPVIGTLGPLGFEVHCEGEIYGQTAWDLSQALVAKHGPHTGWRTSERIFFNALADSGSYLPSGSFPIYDAYLQSDDDDGNLANGTPNGQEIFDAFDAHGIAGGAVVSSPTCTRPDQPVLVVTPGCAAVELTWNAVPGVDAYAVFRSELLEDRAFHHLADLVPGQTSYTDHEVAPGIDYYYVVASVAPDGCESTVEGPQHARLAAQPVLTATAALPSDEPVGNRSGFADPGEQVDLVVTLSNVGELDANSVSGTLTSSTPGVTLLDAADGWPAIPAGGAAPNAGVLRFETDAQTVACGDTLRFRLEPADASACLSEDSFFDVALGDRTTTLSDDFETDQGWSHDLANSTAATGTWTLGDPDGTDFQPEDDVSVAGTQAWFTSPNPGGIGGDDVDDGTSILLSPVFDLSGQSEAIFSYYRWFANRDLGEDAGDFFAADASSDGGGSWVNLETLDSNESAAAWTRREFALHDFIPLNGTVRFRFQVADGPATGNLIEAAVDEMRIEEPLCDSTPACFSAPTFAGLESASPGASCGETALAWSAAESNCLNATVSYNVYRSTTSGFTPGPGNRVAAGLTATSYVDSLLAPGVTYHYVVRADDSRSGEDGNVVESAVVAAAAPDLVAPLFQGLESASSGAQCGEVDLSWAPALESCSGPVAYRVYRSTDPGFIPDAATLVGSSFSLGFQDATLSPGADYTYVVRARDEQGNEDANDVRITVAATALDLSLVAEDFEQDDGGFSVVAPDDAVTGNWEWGDPQGDGTNPEDDHTPDPGVRAWVTGLSATSGGGNNDIDDGTTTLLSSRYSLAGSVDPIVRYARWFTNDLGQNPGEDPLDVEVSDDDGASWALLERVSGGVPLDWIEVELPLAGIVVPTPAMRFRFTARDTGVGGSLVEAGIDDFELVDRGQGCSGCPLPVTAVGSVSVDASGDDVVLDWSADPVQATRYIVYRLNGPAFDQPVAVGSTDGKVFVHEGARISGQSFFYRVSAVDACGNESAR